jgi:hypothetical protein
MTMMTTTSQKAVLILFSLKMESTLLPITKNPKWSLAKESFNVKPLVTGTSSL